MKNFFLIIAGVAFLSSCSNRNYSEEQAALPVLLSNTKNNASCVYLTKDENNMPIISWCEIDTVTKYKYFFISFFDEKKNLFDRTISVPIEQNAGIHEEGMPKIAVKSDGTIIAVYETFVPTKQNEWAGFVHYIQSFDKGNTWTKPLCVHQDTTSGKDHSFASVVRLSDGEVGVCWLDVSLNPKGEGRSVKFSKTNGSKAFQQEKLIDSFACECCRTAISSDDKGNVSILFRNILPGSVRDISYSISKDNGKSFSTAIPFSNDNWVINGCPHDGPSVAINNNAMYAAWFTGGAQKGLYYAKLINGAPVLKKQISSNGRFIQLCLLSDDKKIVAYNQIIQTENTFYSKIVVTKIDGNNLYEADITMDKAHASYPVLCTLNNSVIVGWTDNDKVYYRVKNVSDITKLVQPSFVSEVKTTLKLTSDNDPVCGMNIKNGYGDTSLFKGKVFGFCSSHCKQNFLEHPKNYVSIK